MQYSERDGEKAKVVHDKVMEFIALNDQPISVFENPGFHKHIWSQVTRRLSLPALCKIFQART